VILPLSGSHLPGPTWERGMFFILSGRPVQWLAERWKTRDTWACPTLAVNDPERPGYSTSVRMLDLLAESVIRPAETRILEAMVQLLEHRDRGRISLGLPPTLQSPSDGLQPTTTWRTAYRVAGHAYLFVGERWREGEHYASLSPCVADDQRPGVMLTTRMLDVRGDVVSSVSFAEVLALLPSGPDPEPRLCLAQADAT
jgi:hypothetical protein